MADLDLTPLSDAIAVPSGTASLVVEAAGAGPAIVCLHAGVADRRSWRPMAPHLAGHRVVAFDRRGFGDTVVSAPEPYDHVADLVAVMDALDVERAVLVGNSQGGRVAMDATLEHPGRVAGLMMVGAAWTGAHYPEDPPQVQALEQLLRAAEESNDLDAVNRVEARIWLDGCGGDQGRVGGVARELFLDMNGRALRADDAGTQVDHPPAWPRLGSVGVPVAVVEGSLDLPPSLEVARAAVAALPDGRLEVLDGVAHLPTLERPDRVAGLVAELVARTR